MNIRYPEDLRLTDATGVLSAPVSRGWPGRIWVFAIQTFFVGMLVLPTTFQLQRGVALAVLTGSAALLALRHWRVRREILILWIATTVVGILGVTWGVVNDAPGALRVSTVYAIWPALYLLFISLAHSLTVMRRLESALLLGVGIATAMALTVLAAGLFDLGDIIFPLFAFQDAGFGAYEGFTELRLYNLTTLMYGLPFVISLLLARRRELSRWQKSWLWLLAVLLVVVALGSGRRMFWLVVLLTPFLALFFLQYSALRLRAVPMFSTLAKLGIVAAVAATALIVAFGLQPTVLAQEFIAAFLGREASSGARYEQAVALWHAFSDSPLIGVGLGSEVEVTRSKEQPWAYELWHLALLTSVGVLGFTIYSIAVGWIGIKGMVLARRDPEFAGLFLPLVTALVGFLIMTGTNPYLGKFDYLWVIFLPVALINAYLTRRSVDA